MTRRLAACFCLQAIAIFFGVAAQEYTPVPFAVAEPVAVLALAASFALLLKPPRSRRALPPVPALPPREPMDRREGLDPASPDHVVLLSACPVCGMDDPERFKLGVGAAKWHGWPAHDSCVAWLGDETSAVVTWQVRKDLPEICAAAGFGLFAQERAERVATVVVHGPLWSVEPARGMAVRVTESAGLASTRSAVVELKAADAFRTRTDLVCWQPSAPGELMLVSGEPGIPAPSPPVPAGAEIIAWIGIPAGCTQVYAAMIRCALPAELPGLR